MGDESDSVKREPENEILENNKIKSDISTEKKPVIAVSQVDNK